MDGFESKLAAAISEASGVPFRVEDRARVGGGCINDAFWVEGGRRRYFVKTNRAVHQDMFEAEFAGLAEIHASGTVKVPQPICAGVAGERAFIVLEYIRFGHRSADARLGERLAAMHRCTAPRFGWYRDNTIGSTAQINTQCDKWVEFWTTRRMQFQLDLARQNGAASSLLTAGEKLLESIPQFFTTYSPSPSLLHGDLWGGNAASDESGEPVIFDPAVYYGDRETDVAMTELFGGFSNDFYSAYQSHWPLDSGYAARKTLYNLYHILNHFNLFGGGYAAQAEAMIRRLLAQVG